MCQPFRIFLQSQRKQGLYLRLQSFVSYGERQQPAPQHQMSANFDESLPQFRPHTECTYDLEKNNEPRDGRICAPWNPTSFLLSHM